ncbi:MAG: aspartate/glutamate racemase family protein [Parachlamydiaceae bacterium]|nr:aspartate/glutamate racemase family protein [Parachlamydiaceae bacterium]
MKKLGIIGGAGPLASALFYETLVQECYRLKRSLPEILLLNYPFTRGLTPEEKQINSVQSQKELSCCLDALEIGGAEVAVLVCNTLHLELAKVPQRSVRFQSIPSLVLKDIKEKRSERLLLLGTQNTCHSPLYQETGKTFFLPSIVGQSVIDGVINNVLEGNICKNDSRLIEELIKTYPEHIEGVILGCTDLPVLHHHFPLRSDITIYDSVKISAKSILRYL